MIPELSDPQFLELKSYPRPARFEPVADIKPRPLYPLSVPPEPTVLPSLPSPQRPSALGSKWKLTTHLVPAAYPRSTPDIDVSPPVFSQDKAEWKQRVEDKLNELTGLKEKQAAGELDALPKSTKPLWCVLDRYKRVDRKYGNHQGVTLFFVHANGFNKEVRKADVLYKYALLNYL